MRVIAFYLPQFHPIPENDEWWGGGFTEWTNVAKARPLFSWQEQPFLPGELGFYDLRVGAVRQAQAELARAHGINAFCYYHYWFAGRHLLERPFEEVLESGQPDFPFCLCWANENWTKTWDGLHRDILVHQQHSEEDDRDHLRWLARAFRDRRYVKVHGRPLLLVYRVSLLPDPARTAAIWREEARTLGLEEPFLCTVESLRDDRPDPRRIGFDAAVEFQPDWLNVGTPELETEERNRVFDYESFLERQLRKPAADYTRFPCVTPNWDNTARRQRDAFIMRGSTPELYQRWLESVIESRRPAHPEEDLVFINSWNEWGEGAQLEPTRRWGRGYLEGTRKAIASATRKAARRESRIVTSRDRTSRRSRVTVCIPTFNGASYVGAALQSILDQTLTDLDIIIVDDASTDNTAEAVGSFKDRRLSLRINSSRLGIAGNWNRCLEFASSPFVCIFHQDDLMMPANLAEKVGFLERHRRAGMVYSNVWQIGPADELLSKQWYFPPDPADNGAHRGMDFFRRLLSGPNIVCAPSVVARRDVFDVVGGFEPSLPFTLDWEMWLRIAAHYDIGYLVDSLVKYRRHPGMETNQFAGARDLEEGLRAKLMAIERARDLLEDADPLKRAVAADSHREALDRAEEQLLERRLNEARAYLTFALGLEPLLGMSEVNDQRARWLLSVASRIAGDPSLTPSRASVSDLASLPLSEDVRYWEALTRSRAIDISHKIAVRKLMKAVGFKVAAKPGFGWLTRLIGDPEENP